MEELQVSSVPINISQSELKTFSRCLGQWWLKYALDLRPNTKSRSLSIGGLFHDILATWEDPIFNEEERTLESLREILKNLWTEKSGEIEERERVGVFSTLLWMEEEYYKKWKGQWPWKTLNVETEFRVPIFEEKLVGFIHGRVDSTVEDEEGSIWFLDHKTTEKFSWGYLEFDPQTDLYCLAGSKLFGSYFRGIIFNFIRTKPSKAQPLHAQVKSTRSVDQLSMIEHNLVTKLRALGTLGPDQISWNRNKNCDWDCSYKSACRAVQSRTPLARVLESSFHFGKDEDREEVEEGGG